MLLFCPSFPFYFVLRGSLSTLGGSFLNGLVAVALNSELPEQWIRALQIPPDDSQF